MRRSELEHLIRAAGAIADEPQIVVIGSQAVLAQFPDAPAALLASMEADSLPEGLCLEVHDLAISKYVAGREKDLEFTRALAKHRMTRKRTLLDRLAKTKLQAPVRRAAEGRIARDFPSRSGG